jgi:predicted MFS family arabinose efflux permease
MAARPSSLWRHADFLKFWIGQTISGFGSRFTSLALPLIAITALEASPAQLGVLTAMSGLPWLVLGPFVGVGVDRFRRRPVLIATDLGRALLLGSIPLAWMVDVLTVELLYVVAFGVGVLSMWFDTAYQSYVPALVERAQLLDANGKLSVSNSVADVAGPSIAGITIQLLGAPLALAIDALSFLVSTASLWLIGAVEPPPTHAGTQRTMVSAVREGLSYLGRQPLLRGLAGANATFMFCFGMVNAVFLFFLTENVGVQASTLGLMFGVGSVGGLLGALVAGQVSRAIGIGPAIIGSSALRGLGLALIPLVGLLNGWLVPLVVVCLYGVHQWGWSIWSVTQLSVRQALVPTSLQGRVTASFLLLVRGTPPLGALLGGALGEWLGVPVTLAVAAPGLVAATLWVAMSPLWHMREPPTPTTDG